VPWSRDNRHSVEDGAIHGRLSWEATEIVSFALDLKPVEFSIDCCEIDPGLALAQAHL
jgi:hypothetical protein